MASVRVIPPCSSFREIPSGQSIQTALQMSLLCAAFASIFVISSFATDRVIDSVNWVGPACLLVSFLALGFALVRKESLAVFTPLFWLLAASAAYFGMGPLIFSFGDPALADLIPGHQVDRHALLKTNTLNAVGLSLIGVGFYCVSYLKQVFTPAVETDRAKYSFGQISAGFATIIFLGIGLPIKYGLALPHEFGQLSFVLPGSIYLLADFVPIGLCILAYLSTQQQKWKAIAFYVVFSLELMCDLMRFNKTSFLLLVILASLGRFLGTRQIRTLVWTGAMAVCLYCALVPIVTLGRNYVHQKSGVFSNMPWASRVNMAGEALRQAGAEAFASKTDETARSSRLSSANAAWARLSYVDVQNFAMTRYEMALPGKTLQAARYVFIPRIVWPEKPIISNAGTQFTQLSGKFHNGSTGLGVFGEAYWNAGWFGVTALSLFIGALYAIISSISMACLRRKLWLFMPCIFIGIRMGFRIDGWFVIDFAGAGAFYLAFTSFIVAVYIGWGKVAPTGFSDQDRQTISNESHPLAA